MSICAVIISYHPSEEIIENVNTLIDQVNEIVIVDNGSGSVTKELLDKFKSYTKVQVVYLIENLGVAAALNVGVKIAKINNHQWIIAFDQDSQATPLMIEKMLQAYDTYPDKEKVASLSPRYKDKNTGQIHGNLFVLPTCETLSYTEAQEIITSGNLLKMSIFDSVGYFNEELFIDYVDIEYCLRCITQGYKILEVKDAVLVHSIGSPTQHKILWKTPTVSNHSALRRYYIARNAIYIYKKFAFKQPSWTIKNAYALLKVLVAVVLFESERRKKLSAICYGFVDGLLGRMGKCRASI